MSGQWWEYVAIGVASAALTLFLTPVAMSIANHFGVLDRPGGHKSHKTPTPYLGGLAILGGFAISLVAPVSRSQPGQVTSELVVALGLAMVLAVIGFIDDARTLPFIVRLIAEIGAGVVLWNSEVRVDLSGPEWTNVVITVIWFVGITNAFNLLDNMDGLSSGLAAIAATSFFAIGAANGQHMVAALAIAVAGCAVGFLRYNFFPAKIYMGDGGALFFGFMVAYLGLKIQPTAPNSVSYLVPIIVGSVAVLDTSLVTFNRLRHGLSPFVGGRDHVSHRLVRVGLPVPVAVSVIYAAGMSVGVIGYVVSRSDVQSAVVLSGLVFALLISSGILLSLVPVYETSRTSLYKVSKVD